MATKTQKRQASTMETMQADYEAAVLEADEVLRTIVEDGRSEPNAAEQIFFRNKVSWEWQRIIQEIWRMRRVMALERIAGKPADRAAAKEEATTSASTLETERPKLEAQIEQLQAELRGYETAAERATSRLQEYREAVASLRDLTPEHIKAKADELRRETSYAPRLKRLEAETRRDQLAGVLRMLSGSNRTLALEVIAELEPEAVEKKFTRRRFVYQLTSRWPATKQKWEADIVRLNAEIEQYRAEEKQAEDAAGQLLDFYAV